MKKLLVLIPVAILINSFSGIAQCNWSDYYFESFEYTTPNPYVIPGTTYGSTPATYTGCTHSGSRGLYMNIINDYTGLIYSQEFNTLCIGKSYRFSFFVRDAWSSTNNLTFNVYDGNNTLLLSTTVLTNSIWQNIIMPEFTCSTSSIRFEIITNTPGGPGNDVGFDDFVLSWCNSEFNTTYTQCAGAGNFNLFDLVSSEGYSNNGQWSGPSGLDNGYLGTFDASTDVNGNYSYTIDGISNCPDSVANVVVNMFQTPDIQLFNQVSACSEYLLPVINGTNLSGQQNYFTMSNGSGIMLQPGDIVNTSTTLYAFDGITGCFDEETLIINIDQPNSAGNDNGASYCGTGQIIALNSFLSIDAALGGSWMETSLNPSGTFNTTTAQWNTTTIDPGTYTFEYLIPANGTCPADIAQFTVNIGDMQPVNLGNDTTLCAGQTIWLSAGNGYNSYLWNTGSTNTTKYINQAGTYWVRVEIPGENQIANGDFESGFTGFSTNYQPGTGGPWGILSNAGNYAFSSSPSTLHSNFVSCQDHTVGSGNQMMVVNGSSQPNTEVWCQNVPVQPNTTYQFGTWVTSVTPSNPAQLQFSINNSSLGNIFSPSGASGNWTQFYQTWNSGMMTSAEICIVNQNTVDGGNDFALDDITFLPICYSTDTVQINYAPYPVIELGLPQTVCEGTVVTLNAGNPGCTYEWNTGAIEQQIEIDSSGIYTVVITSPFGCSVSDFFELNFEEQKTAGVDSSAVLCSTTNTFNLNSILDTNAFLNGTWTTNNFNTIINNGEVQLSGQSGQFNFNYIVSGIFCPGDTSEMLLTINNQPVAASNSRVHFCNSAGEVQDLSNYFNHPSNSTGSYWNFSQNLDISQFDVINMQLTTGAMPHGEYDIQNILLADSMCIEDTTILSVKITALPDVNFYASAIEGCQPLEISFENQSTVQGDCDFTWDFGNGEQLFQEEGGYTIYEDADCYDVNLTITADGLCTSNLLFTDYICVHPNPVASFEFGPQQVYSDGPEVQFENASENNYYNYWSFGDGDESSEENPEHNYPLGEIDSYEVILFVESEFGCKDSTSKVVEVKDQLLFYVPNSFTPDGDEYNNTFTPVLTAGIDVYDFRMEIYNRWGEQVFVTNDFRFGWDGTYNSSIAQDGMYVWSIEFGLLENDERMRLVGNVNLLR